MYQEDSFKTSQVVYAHTRSDEADMEYKMHCHNSYEIYYMVKGNVEYFLEGTSYVPKPGSLLIIPPKNGILIPWKNVDLIAGNCRILQFAHGSYRF